VFTTKYRFIDLSLQEKRGAAVDDAALKSSVQT
jgi:hypothetical protein